MFDRNDEQHLQELYDEVTLDPDTLGYIPASTDTGVINVINLIRAEYTVEQPFISIAAIKSATFFDAFEGLVTVEESWFNWLTNGGGAIGELDLATTPDLIQKLAGVPTANDSIWAAADRNAMNAAMQAIIFPPSSRAEDLWGYNTNISSEDWFAARDFGQGS